MHPALEEVVRAARARPEDVIAQVAAAYACDRAGDEALAITFYDAAHRLGVPHAERVTFLVGYGSTLRNVGRTAEAIEVLEGVCREAPDEHAARCFHAFSLHSAGRSAEALGQLLDVVLALADSSPSLGRYRRALGEYRAELGGEDQD